MEFLDPALNQLEAYWVNFLKLLPQIGLAILVLTATAIMSKFSGRLAYWLLGGVRTRPALREAVRALIGVGVWVVGVLLAAVVVFPSVTPAQFVGALGIGGIAIGLAFRDMFENFMAGFMIMIRRPMRMGDTVEVNGIVGRVEEITLRDTYLRKPDDELAMLPNSMIFKNAVRVLTDRERRRYEIVVGVAYDEDAAQARQVIERAVNEVASVTGVEVFAREFGASSIDFLVRWWARSDLRSMHQSRSDVVIAVKAALDEAGIEIPYPYRTLTFKGPTPFAEAHQGRQDASD